MYAVMVVSQKPLRQPATNKTSKTVMVASQRISIKDEVATFLNYIEHSQEISNSHLNRWNE